MVGRREYFNASFVFQRHFYAVGRSPMLYFSTDHLISYTIHIPAAASRSRGHHSRRPSIWELSNSSSTNSLCRKTACAGPKYRGARKTARKDVCLLIRVGQVGRGPHRGMLLIIIVCYTRSLTL